MKIHCSFESKSRLFSQIRVRSSSIQLFINKTLKWMNSLKIIKIRFSLARTMIQVSANLSTFDKKMTFECEENNIENHFSYVYNVIYHNI